MLKRLTRRRRWMLAPVVALIGAAGFATTSGAINRESRAERVCANLDAKEARQQAALAQAEPNTPHYFILQSHIARTEQQEANHGCGD
jgi:hypothetical protein